MNELEDKFIPDPNTEYDYPKSTIATFNSETDVAQFLNRYNHDNKYYGLKLGMYIQINDGIYNEKWKIVGFDCEYNRDAIDGSTYDNGYGICLLADNDYGYGENKSKMPSVPYNTGSNKPYISSTIRTQTLPTIANNLKNVLGSHLIERNVLLGSKLVQDKGTTAYTWTKDYCTLMTIWQTFGSEEESAGKFGTYDNADYNKYDIGEANYKLPIFNYESKFFNDPGIWYRGTTIIKKYNSDEYAQHAINSNLDYYYELASYNNYTTPMIYIR